MKLFIVLLMALKRVSSGEIISFSPKNISEDFIPRKDDVETVELI